MNKIMLRFSTCFWEKEAYSLCYASEIKGELRWWYNLMPLLDEPILLAFSTANSGWHIEKTMNDTEIVEKAMNILKMIYGDKVEDPIQVQVTRWGQDVYSFGSYSYIKVGSNGSDCITCGKPVKPCLFFAGEHTSKDYQGCVHGAYESGIRAALEIQESLKQSQKFSFRKIFGF